MQTHLSRKLFLLISNNEERVIQNVKTFNTSLTFNTHNHKIAYYVLQVFIIAMCVTPTGAQY